MLHKTDNADWPDESLQPIAAIEPSSPDAPAHLGALRVVLKSGVAYEIDFSGIDGSSSR
jgi:hypothetical protein